MSVPGLLFALLLAVFVLVWILMPLLERPTADEADDPLLEKQRDRLQIHYERILRNIRDLDEDHALSKISDDDYTREREDWAQRGVQVLQALDAITARETAAETPTEGVDAAGAAVLDDAIEAAIQTYRKRKTQ